MIKKIFERFDDLSLSYKGIKLYKSFLKDSCFYSKEKIQAFQFKRLKELLIESSKNVPYYKNLFNEIGFVPERDFNTLEDIKKIPILTKTDARKYREELINKKFEKKALIFKTSGSSGNPFVELISRNQWIVEQGVVWRHWKWAGYNFRDTMAIVRSYVPKNDTDLIKYEKARNFIYYSPFHLGEDNILKYLNHMNQQKIKFLRGYPSSLLQVALVAKKHNIKIPTLKGMLTASEVLTENDRETIEDAFGVKISNHYGLAEQVVMFGDCEKHEGMHNYDEYGYLELLDTQTENIKKIIGTNINNFAMPLIRYDTEDLAVVGKGCSCNRSSQTVLNVIGRNDVVIKLRDGSILPTVNFYTMFEHYPIERWQVLQHTFEDIEVKISGNKISNEELSRRIYDDFMIRIPDNIKINLTINFDKDFHQVNEGKKNAFVSFVK